MPLGSLLDGYLEADPLVAGLVIAAVVIAAIVFVVKRARERR